MRVIPSRPPRFDDFNLPDQLRDIVELKNGIVLVTGPTGSGKSSSLAAVIDLINETKFYHIVTIEDPIEFLHAHKTPPSTSASCIPTHPTLRWLCAPRCARRRK